MDGVEQGIEFHPLRVSGLERRERGQAEREQQRGDRDRHQELEK